RSALRERRFRTQLLATLPALAIALFCFARFLAFNETRNGVAIPDPVLALITPRDLTWIIFGLIYLSSILAIIFLSRHPHKFLLGLQSYTLLVVVRLAAMYVLPLNPPAGMIALEDPFVQSFGSGQVLLRD